MNSLRCHPFRDAAFMFFFFLWFIENLYLYLRFTLVLSNLLWFGYLGATSLRLGKLVNGEKTSLATKLMKQKIRKKKTFFNVALKSLYAMVEIWFDVS